MKKLFLLLLCVVFAFITHSQTIRYWHDDNPNKTYLTTIHKQDFPYYALAYYQDGEYVTGWQLRKLLKQSIWPDVPFTRYLPREAVPILDHIEYITVFDTIWNGNNEQITVSTQQVKVWDYSPEQWLDDQAAFLAKLQEYFVIVQQGKFTKIPGDEGWNWEIYNPDWVNFWEQWIIMQPDPNLYTGAKIWTPTERDDLWDDWQYYILFQKGGRLWRIHQTIQR